jgi:DNA-binding NarL/FixJ family response regulator
VRIAVGQFEDIVTRGLRALIEDDDSLQLVASGVPREQLAGVIAAYRPDVVVINFGSLQNAGELRVLHTEFPQTRLLVLANRPTSAEVQQMLAFGATACLSKSTQERDLLHAIHLASRGLQVLPRTDGEPAAPSGPEQLTPRETDVLELLRAGRSNGEIAQALHVSIETVRTHARRIYRKLGVRTRRELAARR